VAQEAKQATRVMLILDTDHVSVMLRDHPVDGRLVRRLASRPQPAFLTIITVGELHRGWLALINKARQQHARLRAYDEYFTTVEALRAWEILPWTKASDDLFERLVAARVRIGTMDLRIAAIALSVGATLLTRNVRDFSRIPDLPVENWLD
jgi:tRNA(fMet)-specific endonuclease VapC